jgi:hypothetical protein
MPKIYTWFELNPHSYVPNGGHGHAMDEAGNYLASHYSSNISWAKHDIGASSDWHHEAYRAAHPEGFEIIWLGDTPATDAGWVKAWEINQAQQAQDIGHALP